MLIQCFESGKINSYGIEENTIIGGTFSNVDYADSFAGSLESASE